MEIILLAGLTAAGFILLWIKILGFKRAVKYQVVGDILITGTLLWLGAGTFTGVAMAACAGLMVSLTLGLLKYAA